MTLAAASAGAANPVGRQASLLAGALALTFVVIRLYLHWRADTDLNVGAYNVHHLFTGVLLIAVCGIPAILRTCDRRMHDAAVVGFGVGLALALDEWVYLIATDGSNAAYLLPVSLIPGAAMVALACAYTAVLGRRHR